MVSILALALAGCQSGGGTEPAQSAAEQVDDGLCHGPDGAVDCHGATCVNGECLNNTQCEDPNKPVCHAHKCEPCSGANDCNVGTCDTKSGQCVECLADDDCEFVSSDGHVTNSNVWGHIDHSFGTAPRTMCVEHQCVACNVSTCMVRASMADAMPGKRQIARGMHASFCRPQLATSRRRHAA